MANKIHLTFRWTRAGWKGSHRFRTRIFFLYQLNCVFNYFAQIFCLLTFAVRTVSPFPSSPRPWDFFVLWKFFLNGQKCNPRGRAREFVLSSSFLFPSVCRSLPPPPSPSFSHQFPAGIDPLPQSLVIRFYQSPIDYQWRQS